MRHNQKDRWLFRYWMLHNPPDGSAVWCYKLVHVKCVNKFSSVQFPSGITVRIILRGSGSVEVADKKYMVTARSIFCAIPGTLLKMESSAEDPWEWLELQLIGNEAINLLATLGLSTNNAVRVLDSWQPVLALRKIISYYNCAERELYRAISLLYDFVHTCAVTETISTGQPNHEEIVKTVQQIIEAKSNYNLNVNDLARLIAVDRSTIQRAFKQQMGITPSEYISRCRLYMAEELLGITQMKIKAVAEMTGFNNDKYFISWFKKLKGTTPAQWRRNRKRKRTKKNPVQ